MKARARRARGRDAARPRDQRSPSPSTRGGRRPRQGVAAEVGLSGRRQGRRRRRRHRHAGVQRRGRLERALRSCSDRGKAAFADARVYLERYVDSRGTSRCRCFATRTAGAYALGERECSVQRRHQKNRRGVPVAGVRSSRSSGRAAPAGALRRGAARRASSAGYVGAGTCEFIARREGNLFFLEVNARLQVEHPSRRWSRGSTSSSCSCASRPGAAPRFVASRRAATRSRRASTPKTRARVHPEPGPIDELVWAGGAGEAQIARLRIESGVRAGSKVTPFYDPMVAKVVAWGETREEAIADARRRLRRDTIAPC